MPQCANSVFKAPPQSTDIVAAGDGAADHIDAVHFCVDGGLALDVTEQSDIIHAGLADFQIFDFMVVADEVPFERVFQ